MTRHTLYDTPATATTALATEQLNPSLAVESSDQYGTDTAPRRNRLAFPLIVHVL